MSRPADATSDTTPMAPIERDVVADHLSRAEAAADRGRALHHLAIALDLMSRALHEEARARWHLRSETGRHLGRARAAIAVHERTRAHVELAVAFELLHQST